MDVGEEANLLHVDLLLALLDETATGIHVVRCDLLLNLLDCQTVGHQLLRVHDHLVLAREAAKARHVHYAGNAAERLLQLPVFDALQLHRVDRRIRALQRVPVDLADGTPVCTDLRLQSRG